MNRFHATLATFIIFSLWTPCVHAYDITLAWDPSSDMNIAGYNLYIRLNDSEPYALFHELTLGEVDSVSPQFNVLGMQDDVTYYFVVTAVDINGLESDFSNEVSVINSAILEEDVRDDNIIEEDVSDDNINTVNDQIHSVAENSGGGSGGGCFISTIIGN